MSDAFEEFLNENVGRRYPFVEDATLISGIFHLQDDVVLDLRGFHRERPEITPQLRSIIGGSSGQPGAVAGSYVLIFRMGRTAIPLDFKITVPESNAIWPFVQAANLVDPLYPASRLGTLRATVGAGVLNLLNTQAYDFVDTAPIEPSLIGQLYRTQVDFLKIIHDDADSEYVGGDLLLRGGYNVDLVQTGQEIEIAPSLGGGELGRFLGSTNDPETTSKCKGAVLAINGATATNRGEFFIKNGPGILVKNLPLENKIQILLQPASLGTICSPIQDSLIVATAVTDQGDDRVTDGGDQIVFNP